MEDKQDFHGTKEILNQLFAQILPDKYTDYGPLFSGWQKIAGEEMAFHVRPQNIIRGVFILESDHPGWTQRVKLCEEKLLFSIKKNYPNLEIQKMRVVGGGRKTNSEKHSPKNEKKDLLEKTTCEKNTQEKDKNFRANKKEKIANNEQNKKFITLLSRIESYANP